MSPVALQPGDQVLWIYANDLLLAVEIKEVTQSSLWRRQPIYHVTSVDCEGSHDVLHDNLFIPHDHNDMLDPKGLPVANMDRLRVPDALNTQALPDAPKHLIQKWGSVDSVNFRISSFTTAMKDEHLMNDSLPSIDQFYASIKIFIQATYKRNMDILSELLEVSPMNILCLAISPTPLYAEYGRAKACYDSIGHVLKYILCKNKLIEKALIAEKVLLSHIGRNKDGWYILHELLRDRLPYLGATGFDTKATTIPSLPRME